MFVFVDSRQEWQCSRVATIVGAGKRRHPVSEGPFLNINRALKAFFEVSQPEPVRPGDPDYALVRARRRQPTETFPSREIEARLARLKKAQAG